MNSRFDELEGILPEKYGLTTMELRMLGFLPGGVTRKKIARNLNLSVHTIDTYLASAYRKLGAKDKAEAVAKILSLQSEPFPPNFFW